MTVLGCIVHQHNIWLMMLSGLICVAGSSVTAQLFLRTLKTSGLQKTGWHFLTAIVAGVAIWCTHFVGMLGFDTGLPVGFDPFLTMLSLVIAIVGSAAGFVFAGSGFTRFAPVIGGTIVGLTITFMHYTGMMAYRVQGIVSWDMSYLVASIVLSVGLSATALHFAMQAGSRAGNVMTGLLSHPALYRHDGVSSRTHAD